MKKLYRKSTVHPSPSLSSDPFSLSFLPAAILSLAAALSADDREVLAYLLSCSSTFAIAAAAAAATSDFVPPKSQPRKKPHHHQHPPSFSCYCFSCYTSYWARWDSSSNRQLIHEIIDAVEDGGLVAQRKKKQGMSKKEKRKNHCNNSSNKNKGLDLNLKDNGDISEFDESARVNHELGRPQAAEEAGGQLGHGDEETGERGSVRRLVSFIGERIWGSVWG